MGQEIDKEEFDDRVKFENGKVSRRFTQEWKESGIIKKEKIPELVMVLVEQNFEMVEYIEALQDKLDWVLKKNRCCDISSCLRAGCTSDHK